MACEEEPQAATWCPAERVLCSSVLGCFRRMQRQQGEPSPTLR